ncbi:MAG: PAS domain S-box protein [Planctomycetes bacterium]|nr:PAS domain S-box protein [Planctomycetota bacterium]
MSLRKKTLLAVGVTIFGLIVILFVSARIILLGSFARLEEYTVRMNIERATNALGDELSSLDTFVRDWAGRDDVCNFIKNRNEDFVKSNLTARMFIDTRLNFIVFTDTSGEIVYAKAFDLYLQKEVPIPPSLAEHIHRRGRLVSHRTREGSLKGMLLLSDGPVLVASRPVVTSENPAMICGAVIMGRRLSLAVIEDLGDRTRLSLAMRLFDDPDLPPDFRSAKASLSTGPSVSVQVLGGGQVAGYVLLRDIYRKPILILRMAMPRHIYRQGEASLYHAMILLLIAGLIFGVLAVALLEKLVLSPLETLSRSVSRIGASSDLSERVAVSGNDELSSLARDINSMLKSIERAEAALRESEEKYRTLFRDSLEAMNVTRNGKIVDANDAWLALHGFSNKEEVIGMDVMDVVHPEDRAVLMDRRSRHDPPQKRLYQTRDIRKDGTTIDVEVYSSSISLQGDPAVITTVRDITDRKRAEDELKESYRRLQETQTQLVQAGKMAAVGQLAAGVAHEINNPLAVIASSSEILTDLIRSGQASAEKGGEMFAKHLKKIEDNIFRCKSIIEDLLGFARREEGSRVDTDVAALVAESVRLVESVAKAKERRIVLTGDPVPAGGFDWMQKEARDLHASAPSPIHVRTSPRQVQQVLLNLLLNAIDATDAGGSVYASVAAKNGGVEVVIGDTGKGIAPEHLDRIFEPFFTTKPVGKGTGLGLYLSHQIVESLDGTIAAESKVGTGTIMRVWLPKAARDVS